MFQKIIVRLVIVAAIGGLAIAVGRFLYDSYKMRNYEGPIAFPIIGSFWHPGFSRFYRHLLTLSMRHRKIFKLFTFSRPLLVISDPYLVRRILSDHKTFYKGEDYTKYFGFSFGKGLVTTNGEDHRKGRSLLGKYFIRSSVAPFANAVNKIAKQAILDKFGSQLLSTQDNEKGLDFNVEEFFGILALRCFLKFSCDYDSSVDPEYEKSFSHKVSIGSHAIGILMVYQLPLWSCFPPVNFIKKGNAIMEEFFQTIVDRRKQALADGGKFDDMLQAILEDSSLSHDDRSGHFRTAICAGHDTTAFFMSYCVYLLAKNPDVQQHLYEYLQDKLGDKETITADDTAQLHLLQCVMMETLRLYPIAPVLTRECATDTRIKESHLDLVLPKNTTLMLSIFGMHRDPDIWEEPTVFKPSRFENKASSDFTFPKDGYFPFGYGSRNCIGTTLAQMESSIILVHLIRGYRFSAVPGFHPEIRGGVSLTTSNGIFVHVTSR